MTLSQDSLQAPEVPAPKAQDQLSSGHPNWLRRLVLHLVGWLFRAPYFPSELTWFLLALIASNITVELLPLPAAYWIDSSISPFHTFLFAPLSWGLWNIALFIGYLILVGLALSLLNAKPAFALWIGMSMYHFFSLSNAFGCKGVNYFAFENAGNCSEIHSGVLIVAGILWGLVLLVAARRGLVSWIAPAREEISAKGLRVFSISWIALMSLTVTLAVILTPKPAWRLVQTAHAPLDRTEASLAYDTRRSVAVLFGGTTSWTQKTGWTATNDTWEWDGSDWIQLHTAHSPSPRFAAGMAFDETRGVTVLFGGSGQDANYQTTFNGDTWEWNGKDWLEISPPLSPPPRQDPNMFFDPLRGTVVIHGGYFFEPITQTKVFLDDAWEWDGKVWERIAFDEPRRNSASAIVYDPIRQIPLLMDVEGLWSWQESRWVPASFPTNPPSRWGSAMVYQPRLQQIVLYGGYKDKDVFDDTWVYDGQTWQQVITTVQPPRRNGHNLFYDQTRGRILLFGGLDGSILYNDMWELEQP